MSAVLKVDVWSDVACPWCYIGKRRFEDGVRRYAAAGGTAQVEVEFHSFELAPDLPEDFSGSVVEYLSQRRGIPVAQVERMLASVTALAAEEGLAYDFASVQQTRTLKAHELLHLAKAHGRQAAMKERLLRAYFVEGRDLGHDEELADLAAEVGLDRAEAKSALSSGRHAPDVTADMDQARAYGISGVPFYVIDGRYGISGAQPADTFARALAQAAAEAAAEAAVSA